MSNAPGRTDWAEDDEPDLATALPAPQRTKNKDGTETIVTVYINEDGKKVKRTQRLRTITKRIYEKPGVAERKKWPKMGIEAERAPGPHSDTTTLGENIIFRPVVGYKSGAQEKPSAEEDKKTDALKKMQIKCRICSGDHFTTKCPFKDTMAPEGEAGAGLADLGDGVGSETMKGLDGGAGPGAGGSSYVPPHLRNGGAGAGGERMGGKFERDDLATLRVTNVSPLYTRSHVFRRHPNTPVFSPPYRSANSPKKTSSAHFSNVSAVLHVSSLPRTERLAAQRASLSSALSTDPTPPWHARRWMVSVTVT